MQPSSDQPVSNRNRQLKRWGPLIAIAVVVVVIVVIVAVAGGGDDKKEATTGSGSTSSTPSGGPAGALTYAQAKADGTVDQHTFPHCDKSTGNVAMPYFFAAPCYADVKDNGGATAPQGVTKDTITIGVYIAQENDAVLDYITQAINNNDTNAQSKATYQGYVDMFNSLYQTYGRKVVLKFIDASGGSQDEVAARADAVKAADDLKVFAVWGGPVLTSAFADELAARHVLCIGCTAGDPSFYDERAPYLFSVAINQQQVQDHVVEYIEKKLNGFKAKFAGTDDLKAKQRKFGYLWIESNDDSKKGADRFVSKLKEDDIELGANVSYTLDPSRLQEQATSAIAKFKQAGVTSIVFSGDPVAPSTFTKEATAQDYFPEWVLGPQALVDTNAFARTYDQKQWAHAFGPSPLAARFTPEQAPSFSLYKWFKGTNPPAIDTNPVLFPQPALFFSGVQAAGPNLNYDTFKQGLFERPTLKQAVTQSYISYGRQGFWDYDDYNGGDDMTEVWWDPTAKGPDEIRKQGTGMWRFVDGGKRYLPGKWPKGESKAFDKAGTVTILDEPPAGEKPKDYPPPSGGG
jgi:hypothetical protein